MKSKNRLRFDSIHLHKGPTSLEGLYYRLSTNEGVVTDEEVLNKYFEFSNAIQTNTFAAAELELVTISVICYYKPHLTPILIRRGLLSIVYSLGDEIDAAVIFQFIDHFILSKDVEPYGGLPPGKGIIWLSQILPTQTDLVQKTLDEVIEQNRLELGDM